MGFVKQEFLKKIMYGFEKLCYDKSDLIVTLSPGSEENIKKRYKNYNIVSVPNSANIELFQKDDEIDERFKLQKNRYAIYTGNIGQVNNSRLLLEVAEILKRRKINDLKIVLVGDGQEKDYLKKRSIELNLGNHFQILDLMPKEDLVPLIKNSMASLIPLANTPLLDTSSPNKLFESLAAGIPVVQTTNGWIKDLLEEESCGFTVSAKEPADMVDALLKLRGSTTLRKEMSANAFRVAKTKFDKQVLANKMLRRMEEIL